MEPIRRIADLPFREREPLELLGLAGQLDAVDLDYDEFGYSQVDALCLHRHDAADPEPVIRDALVLALHSADQGEALDRDIELEFFIDEVAEGYSVTVLLSDFLTRWLPRVSAGERAIVLALCNPHGATIARPAIVGATPLYYAIGDVESCLDQGDGQALIGLVAADWRIAHP